MFVALQSSAVMRYLTLPRSVDQDRGKEPTNMDQDLEDYRTGKMTFDQLVRKTRPHWGRLAQYLMRRWKTPTWVVDEEDLVQQMLEGAWIALREWDPARGTPLKAYVIWNSVDKAKKHLHVARKAKRRDDRAPSRIMPPVSSLAREGDDGYNVAAMVTVSADQDTRCEARTLLQGLQPELRTPLLEFLNEGSFSSAAWTLLENVSYARSVGISTHVEACRLIENAVGALVDDEAWSVLQNQARREKLGVSTLSEARRALVTS